MSRNGFDMERTRALLRSMEQSISDARARRTGQTPRAVPTRPAEPARPATTPPPAAPRPVAGPSAAPPAHGHDAASPPRLKAKPKRPMDSIDPLRGFDQRRAI